VRVAATFANCLLLGSLLVACAGLGNDEGNPTATVAPQPLPSSTSFATSAPATTPTPTLEPSPTPPPLQAQAERILELVPAKPANVHLFTSDYLDQPVYPEAYLDGSPMVPAVGEVRAAAMMRNDLNEFLSAGLGPDAPEVAATLALFDDPVIVERVPDPRLRAAFVVLNVTVAAPLIDSYLTSDAYGGKLEYVETGLAFSESSEPGPDGKQRVGVSVRYQFEHFTAIAPNIVHALLHHDENFSYPEDVIVLTIATVTYLQLLDLQPASAYHGTELCRFNNTFAMALLNSHRAGSPELELIVPGGSSVLPGSHEDYPDFWSMIVRLESTSEPAPALRVVLAGLLVSGTALPASLNFSRETAELIGGRISPEILSDAARVRLSVLLTMISTDEIAALLSLTREETIALFQLAEVEAVLAAHP